MPVRYRLGAIFFLSVILAPFYIGISRFQGDWENDFVEKKRLLQHTEVEQRLRQKLVSEKCDFLKIEPTLDNVSISLLDHFIVDDHHKLIYCFVPKVACTNWKRVLLAPPGGDPLLIAGNETHRADAFRTLSQYSRPEIERRLSEYWKFVFTRHPYERILSAYRNKFEFTYADYFRSRFGTEIIRRFRKQPSNESLQRGHDVTFEEFLNYIASLDTSQWKKAFNEHWRPVFDLCFPCQIHYDFLGKYETLENDALYILEKTGLGKHIKFPKRLQTYKTQPTKDVLHEYYRNISTSYHRKLFELYKEDFTLFEYDTMYL